MVAFVSITSLVLMPISRKATISWFRDVLSIVPRFMMPFFVRLIYLYICINIHLHFVKKVAHLQTKRYSFSITLLQTFPAYAYPVHDLFVIYFQFDPLFHCELN